MSPVCCILGLGYIGLPTAAVISHSGCRVIGVDVNPRVLETVNRGHVHICEPGLEPMVADAVSAGLLVAQDKPEIADVFLIAVPTPFHRYQEGIPQPDTSYVLAAAEMIAPYLRPGNLVIIESTAPVGTAEKVAAAIEQASGLSRDQFHVAYCPERVLPGRILEELIVNDRIVGGLTPAASLAAKDFYLRFCKGSLLTTNASTAELVKLAENSFRDVNIAFANELSIICERFSVDVREIIDLANHHPRVNILQPGCGVGGHCIAVDPWFIASALPDCTPLIQAARAVNDGKVSWVVDQIQRRSDELASRYGRPIRLGCMGLAYKPDVDDLRESPAVAIVKLLQDRGFDVLVCEPYIAEYDGLTLYPPEQVARQADLLIFLVAHAQFADLDVSNCEIFDLVGIHASGCVAV
jgi:UDP-N-acetyl-D-mannosaminuronic acid dehydrogenase